MQLRSRSTRRVFDVWSGLNIFQESVMQPVYRKRKPDPLLILALLVGLGVVVTTTLPTSLSVAAEMLASY